MVGIQNINGYELQKMLASGLALLDEKYKEVDLLNVFPVPDGDTGTNMYLTLSAAVDEVTANSSISVGRVADAASRGALMGARGNSGVILSQLLRGFASAVKDKETITGKDFSKALAEGVDIAFKAVMKPVEGTILTVAREAARTAVREANSNQSLEIILEETYKSAEYTLSRTPEMLPALKEAGVVDAGGMGWLIILNGLYKGLSADLIEPEHQKNIQYRRNTVFENTGISEDFNFEFPYCTEVLLRPAGTEDILLQEELKSLGDSFLYASADGVVKIHIHTAHPEKVLGVCLNYGPVSSMKISNMNEQAVQTAVEKTKKPFGILSVASGEGIAGIMKSLGADEIISGGQSMNPSIQDLAQAVERINAESVIILPNNSNIVMSANQVSGVTEKPVDVVPATTIPEGLSALLAVSPEMKLQDAVKAMTQAAKNVKTGEITYAVRDTSINGTAITKGNIIGLFNDEIFVGDRVFVTVAGLLEKMISPDSELCSIYYGEMIKKVDAENLIKELSVRFPEIDIELHFGGQPVYYFLISVE